PHDSATLEIGSGGGNAEADREQRADDQKCSTQSSAAVSAAVRRDAGATGRRHARSLPSSASTSASTLPPLMTATFIVVPGSWSRWNRNAPTAPPPLGSAALL